MSGQTRDSSPPHTCWPGLCLHQVFEAQAAQRPDAVAVSWGAAQLTYRELNERANQLGHHLQMLGVGPEVLVGLHVERSLDTIIGMLGILKAGGAYVPLDPAYPQERLAHMLQDACVPVLITQSALQPGLPNHHGETIWLDRDAAAIRARPGTNLDAGVSPDNLMYVIYTSGSTGRPKGIMVTHANVARLFPATRPYLAFDAHDTWTLFHSYSFGFSVWEIWGALLHGGRLVIVPPAISQSPGDFYTLVAREQITILSQTPSAFRLFLLADAERHQQHTLHLRAIVFSGEPLDPALLEAWIARHGDNQPQLVNMYAITETAGEVTYRRLLGRDVRDATRNVIGMPLPDVQIYLLDEQQQPVPTGEAGEMYVGSPAVARGYLNLPELTAQKFLPDPFQDQAQARMYRTGDRARYLPTGELEFLGRVDAQVKLRGFRIELGEIESVLNRHPDVQQAVVLVHMHRGEKSLVAYVVGSSDPAALRTYLAARLPEYMLPGAFVPLDQFPLTPNGKVDRGKLPPPDQVPAATGNTGTGSMARTAEEQALASIWGIGAEPAAPPAPPQPVTPERRDVPDSEPDSVPDSEIEARLVQIIKDLLMIEQISTTSNFFDVGANSFHMVQLHARINAEFAVNMSIVDIFKYVTIQSLAHYLQQNQVDTDENQTQRQERGKARRAARRR
jgi:amino acid adenylation domain-containing protein